MDPLNTSLIEKQALLKRDIGITFSSNPKDETVSRDSHDLKSSSSPIAEEETKKEKIIVCSKG